MFGEKVAILSGDFMMCEDSTSYYTHRYLLHRVMCVR